MGSVKNGRKQSAWFLLPAAVLAVFVLVLMVSSGRPVLAESADHAAEQQYSAPGGVTATGNTGFLGGASRGQSTAETEQTEIGSTSQGSGSGSTAGDGGSTTAGSDSTGGDVAREPAPKSDEVTELGGYPVSRVHSPLIDTETYEDWRFSLTIPAGWVVQTTGFYNSLVIKVYDPQMPDRSMFLFCSIFPYLRSQAAKDWYITYRDALEGPMQFFADAPVLSDLTVSAFLASLGDLREFCGTYCDTGITWSPDVIPVFNDYRIAEIWGSNISSFPECADRSVVHLFYDSAETGRDCSCLLTAQPTTEETYYADNLDIGFDAVYSFIGVTAPTEEMSQMMGTLIRLLSTLSFSTEFIDEAMENDSMRPEILYRMPEILIDTQDQFNRKWALRDVTPEIEANRNADEKEGLIRLVDPEKKEIYLARREFYDVYQSSRESFENPNLYPVSEIDEIYYLWAVKYRIEY